MRCEGRLVQRSHSSLVHGPRTPDPGATLVTLGFPILFFFTIFFFPFAQLGKKIGGGGSAVGGRCEWAGGKRQKRRKAAKPGRPGRFFGQLAASAARSERSR